MVTVAIAGGAGNIGSLIAKEIQNSPKHNVIVLSRKAGAEDSSLPTVLVDYTDLDSLTETLKSHNVHTVISVISLFSPEASNAEINLAKAADKAGSKRFIASEWSIPVTADSACQALQKPFRDLTEAALRKTSLEWTRIYFGTFLEYYAYPYLETTLPPFNLFVNIREKLASIPGDGEGKFTFIYSKDLAKFIVAALDLDKWEESTYIFTEKVSVNQLLKMAEEARGAKFTVTNERLDKLLEGKTTKIWKDMPAQFPEEFVLGLLSKLGVWLIEGQPDLPDDKNLKNKFPEIQTTSLKDTLSLWEGK